jgi:hypothetical protein
MTRPIPSLPRRIALAFGSFFSILSRPDFAADVDQLRAGPLPTAPVIPAPVPVAVTPPAPAPTPAPVPQPAPATAALQLLGLFQREARFIDFIEEDIAGYGDADIGAAARVVHEGCRKVLREHFTIAPVRAEAEGSRVTLQAGFDAAAVRLTGNVVGQAPFTGTLGHRGWQVTEVKLPQLTDTETAKVIAQAEVEL